MFLMKDKAATMVMRVVRQHQASSQIGVSLMLLVITTDAQTIGKKVAFFLHQASKRVAAAPMKMFVKVSESCEYPCAEYP